MQILIVDDDADMRQSTEMLLDACGYAVKTAEDADRALSILDSCSGVRVLLTDIMMPGMNGFELANKAKTLRPDLSVIYVTGYSPDVLPEAAQLHGTLLIKPWNLDDMLRAIEHCA